MTYLCEFAVVLISDLFEEGFLPGELSSWAVAVAGQAGGVFDGLFGHLTDVPAELLQMPRRQFFE